MRRARFVDLSAGCAVLLGGSALLTACAADITASSPYFSDALPGGQINYAPKSLIEKRFETVVRQRFDFSCGSAALATLLRYHYDLPQSEQTVFQGMWQEGDRQQIRRLGFSLLDMKRYLEGLGLRADGYEVSVDQIVSAGVPGIALIAPEGYRHFVVVKGVRSNEVLLGDPSLGLRTMSPEEFKEVWNGVYFVLNTNSATGQAHFNGDRQWMHLAAAPVGSPFLDPLSQQALMLTAPFYRDF
ncbi:C39 family peptidase [Pacificimonas flava]|uniref:Fap protein n=1 Tax=Pacificimonas flava TaxID=1234595 RepID=M2TRS1_9SPHN|nr:C39 family peptidase [Pacificimonas flava]EMD84481.1 Fap protein [Pacificimonas flava]